MNPILVKVYCDGGARGNPGPAASAFVVERQGKVLFKDSKFIGIATNNVAEYQAVIFALQYLKVNENLFEKDITFVLDSQLVSKQLAGVFKIKNGKLKELFKDSKQIENSLPFKITYTFVKREKNKLADYLVNETLDKNM